MGPDRNKHIRNVAIILALALAVWKVPGGGTASATISNIFSVLFIAGLFFLGYRTYMEHRLTLFGLEERQRGLLYGSLALLAFALVATSRMWDGRRPRRLPLARDARRGRLGALQRLARIPDVLVSAHSCNKAV